MRTRSALHSAVAALLLVAGATPAIAEQPSGVVGCSTPTTAPVPRRLLDLNAAVASNSFGSTGQTIVAGSASYSFCDRDRDGRIRLEAHLSTADDDFGGSNSALFGVGYQFALGQTASLTPIVRVGYADPSWGEDQLAIGVALSAQGTTFLQEAGARGLWATYEFSPEYTRWRSAADGLDGFDFEGGVLSAFAAVGLDAPLGDRYRGRLRLGHRQIDTDGPTRAVTSAIVGLRRDASGRDCRGCWSLDLWVSRGDGDYEGILLSLSAPIGR